MARESPRSAPLRLARTCLGLGGLARAPALLFGLASCAEPRAATPMPVVSESAATRRRAAQPLANTGAERLRYAVRIDEQLAHIDVEVCPSGFRIERLEAPSPSAQELLGGGKIITPEGDYTCPGDGVELPRSKPDECLHYTVNLPDKTPDPTGLRRVDRDLLASPDLWLWVPQPRPLHVPMRVHFTLPNGVVAALPWPKEGQDFTLSETAFSWKAGGAFAHAEPAPVPVQSGELAWVALGSGFEHPDAVRAWLREGARASSLLFGHFPLPHALVIGVPAERGRASFGMALRGGGPAVVILLDGHAVAESLARDWTCTHEFLHLGVPRLPPEDAWLFEGLATYYTEIVRARAGVITPAQAYQHLLDGFERGKQHAGLRSLRQASQKMRETHAFYRVYWAGAALAFLTDLAARRAGGPTLDTALRAFAECCAGSEAEWDAKRVLAQLDGTMGAPRFGTLASAWLDRTAFPEVGGALRQLGVSAGAHDQAIFQRAPFAALRDAIMAPASNTHADGEPQQGQ